MTQLEPNKPIEYKKVWYDNKVYLLPCDPKLVKIVLRSDTEPEFIYEDDMIRGKQAKTVELAESMDIVKVLYKSGEWSTFATNNSEFKQTIRSVYSYNKDGQTLYAIPKSTVWYIDNNRVSQATFEDTIKRLELMIYSKTKRRCVWETLNSSDGETIWKIKEPVCFENVSSTDNNSYKEYHDDYYGLGKLQTKIRGKRADYFELDDLCYDFYKKEIDDVIAIFEKDTAPKFELGDSREDYWYKVYGRSFDRLRKTMEIINCRKDNNMISNIPMITNIPKIVDYKYIAENGVTIIRWSDSTSTTVTCDPKTADQYTGFVTAIAKKAFGNGGKMLSEWDRLVIKPIEDAKKAEEKAKIEAEKKAKEDKIHAEAKAKRDAKKAKRKKQREIEKLAKQIADEYYAQELTEEAEKLAVKKYGVPKSYLDEYDCGCCECKEFDVMDDETITD